MNFKLLLRNATQVVCVGANNQLFKLDMTQLNILYNSSVLINADGRIHDIGSTQEIDQKYAQAQIQQTIDCSGKCLIPGFVDAHTHSCYYGDRSHEFVMKLEGKSYIDIHKMGGGIYYTVKHVNEATEEQLYEKLLSIVQRAQKNGTTVMEIKSGYGLNPEAEIKQLRVIEKVNQTCKIDLVATYCGAHALPPGMNEEQGLSNVLEVQIPKVKEEMNKGTIKPEFIDVFCEKNIYEVDSTQKILQAGKSIGLIPSYHGEQLHHLGSTVMGVETGSIAISHLEFLDDEGIEAMAKKQVVGVVLPTTHFLLKLQDPPVRKMIEKGVPVALGSDFCPNAHCMSMPLTMSLACLNLKMRVDEALSAATLNSAAALNRSKDYGSIEIGKWGDIVIINEPKWEHIIYQIGDSPIQMVVKKGEIIQS